jgi:hypothetical protein
MAKKQASPKKKDKQNDIDGCDVAVVRATLDTELPVSEGGVQEKKARKRGVPKSKDRELDLDGCDVAVMKATLDEDLPTTEGGVA